MAGKAWSQNSGCLKASFPSSAKYFTPGAAVVGKFEFSFGHSKLVDRNSKADSSPSPAARLQATKWQAHGRLTWHFLMEGNKLRPTIFQISWKRWTSLLNESRSKSVLCNQYVPATAGYKSWPPYMSIISCFRRPRWTTEANCFNRCFHEISPLPRDFRSPSSKRSSRSGV